MKTQLLLYLLSFFYLTATAQYNIGIVSMLESDVFQITYPQQFIQVNFKKSKIPYAKSLFSDTNLSKDEQYVIVHMLKDQIDALPSEFINEYLDISIYPFHIYDDHIFGYYYGNQIVIEAEKIMPGFSFRQSICHAFLRELAYLIHENKNVDNQVNSFISYLNQFNSQHIEIDGKEETSIYRNGYVSLPLSGGYLASEEYVALFAHLMYPETREQLISYLTLNPGSSLQNKINRYVTHLEEIFPSLNQAYFFGEPIMVGPTVIETEVAQNGDQLLNMHELKSNETYDFSSTGSYEEFPSYPLSNDEDITFDGSSDYYEAAYHPDSEEEHIETLFETRNDTTKHNKKKKKKRKKDGTGLLIVGGLLYLTLELLSQ